MKKGAAYIYHPAVNFLPIFILKNNVCLTGNILMKIKKALI